MCGPGPNSEVGARNRLVRFPPVSDRTADIAGGPFRANNGSRLTLFDHFIGERQQARGHDDAERFRGLEVDDERKLARLLYGEIAGLGTIQDFRGIGASAAKAVYRV